MIKSQIIEKLFDSKQFNDCINRIEPDYLREDLKAEVLLIVCEIEESKLIGLSKRNELNFYVARIIFNQIKSNTSPFYKKYRSTVVSQFNEEKGYVDIDELSIENNYFNNPDEIAERYDREIAEELRKEKFDIAISNLDWYEMELINLYKKLGTYRAIEKETGIPFESIYKTIQKSFKEIKCKVLS